MGLFNHKAEARAHHIANAIQAMAEGNLDQQFGGAESTIHAPVYEALRRLQQNLRTQRQDMAQTDELENALRGMIQKHQEGWIDEVISTQRFAGVQARIAGEINDLVASHIAVKMKVVDIVTSYAQGDFSRAMDRLPGKKGQITDAIDKVKRGLEDADLAAKEANEVLSMMARGDLSRPMQGNYNGQFLELKSSINAVSTSLVEIIEDMRHMSDEHDKGDIDVTINAERFQGAYRVMAQGVNEMVNSHIAVKKKAMAVIQEFAEGNYEAALEQFPGKKAFINRTIEELRSNIKNFITEMKHMADEHERGDIDVVIDADRFSGAYRVMARGVNDMVLGHIAVKKKAMAVVKAFGEGNFDAPLEQLPGKKAFINQTIEQVRHNLKALNEDVSMLSEAAAAGLIETRADVSRHQGDFARIIMGMNQTLETIVQPIITVKGAAEMVNSAAREIAAGNNNLSRRTEEQAASLEETAASVEELTATVKQNAANAQQASSLASEASVVAGKGGEVVNKVVSTMASIDESSRKVVEIISVIDGIAFQTNILALNAAVEAARAGEQGRGFAVVAGEVRNLAQRSAAAAKEIKGLISDSVGKVSDGARLVEEAGHTMGEIVNSINRVTTIMTEIADASAEQSCGIDQINVAVAQMDSMTQQNAAMVEEAAAAAESLQDQAAALAMAVASFKLGQDAVIPRRAEVISLPAGARRVSGGRGNAVQMADGEWQQY